MHSRIVDIQVIDKNTNFSFRDAFKKNCNKKTAIIVKPKSEVPKSKVPKSRPKGLGLRMTPLTHPAKKIEQVDSEIKDVG